MQHTREKEGLLSVLAYSKSSCIKKVFYDRHPYKEEYDEYPCV
jgi:hypothetical protein